MNLWNNSQVNDNAQKSTEESLENEPDTAKQNPSAYLLFRSRLHLFKLFMKSLASTLVTLSDENQHTAG
jgi:hypothetical protein